MALENHAVVGALIFENLDVIGGWDRPRNNQPE